MKTTINVAFADDHELMRSGLVTLAHSFDNIRVIADANNGLELIHLLEKSDNIPDVCILDVRMPILNGYDTLLQIKRRWHNIKVLILTAFDNEYTMLKFVHAGADGYLLKNIKPKAFLKAIHDVYNNGVVFPDELLKKICLAIQQKNNNKFITLTDKEYECLELCCTELTLKEISAKMNTSPRTIEGYRDNLFKKLGVHSRAGLTLYAIEAGIAYGATYQY